MIAGALLGSACGNGSAGNCDRGTEGCECQAESACVGDLECHSGRCVAIGGGDTSPGDAGDDGPGGDGPGDGPGDNGSDDGDDAGDSAADDSGGSDPGAPVIVSLNTDVSVIGPGESVLISAIVTDPDGIEDVIGGQLTTSDGTAVYATFAAAAQEGAYGVALGFEQVLTVEPSRQFEVLPHTRTLRVEFFDQSGATSWQSLSIDLGCNGNGGFVCGTECFPGECHPTAQPCPEGSNCLRDGDGVYHCIASAAGVFPDACEASEDCASGFFCVDTPGLGVGCESPTARCCAPACSTHADCPMGGTCFAIDAETDCDGFAFGSCGWN
ncbi:MAG: hypothetical protein AAF721_20765 [Myxococcota bacterium]